MVRFRTDDTMGFKGFSVSYVAVDPFGDFEEISSDSFEATPFPGSLKTIYHKHLDNEDEDDDYDNGDNEFSFNSNKISEKNKNNNNRKYNPNEITSSEAID